MGFWVSSSCLTACLRKLFAGEGFRGDCDNGFAGRGGLDGLRDVACDLVVDLLKDFGVDLLKGEEANFLKRSLSVIGGNTVILSDDPLNKDAEVRDLSGAYRI